MTDPTDPAPMVELLRILRRHERRQFGRITLALVLGSIGAVLSPLLLVVVAALFLFYFVMEAILLSTVGSVYAIVTGLTIGLTVLYFVGLVISLRKEWVTHRHFLGLSEKRPPEGMRPPAITGPEFYISLSPDLIEDDVPPSWALRLPTFWASILIKAWMDRSIYYAVTSADRYQAAHILWKLAGEAYPPSLEELGFPKDSMPKIFLPLCYLLVLDIINLNELWTKAWVNEYFRPRLPRPPQPPQPQLDTARPGA
ncbi:MAG: hypothetical protein M1588_00455 [Planctomycetes bacterium]|nr:hypothetical protein [Planctomycetota bacterium]